MPFFFKLSPEKQAPVTVPNPCLSALAPAQDSPAGSESCNYPCSNCAWQKASAFLGKGVPEHHLAIQSASVCSKDAHHRPLHSSGCSPWPRGDLLAGAGERPPPPVCISRFGFLEAHGPVLEYCGPALFCCLPRPYL